MKYALAAAAMLALPGCASLVAPTVKTEAVAVDSGAYKLDKTHASILFKIGHQGFSSYVGRWENFDASFDLDEANPEAASLTASIDMTSLDIANEAFATELMGPEWFDAAQFPQATFTSTGIQRTGETTARVTGDLTLHGQIAPVTLDVTFNGTGRDLLRGNKVVMGFSATGTIDRTDFGVSKYAGAVPNEVTLEIEAEFLKD